MNKSSEYQHLTRTFGPLYNENSEILILGSFPSVKSREANFFYGHPQNRFWKVISAVYNSPVPISIEEKTEFLLGSRIALWDTIHSCDIIGSSDSSIKNVVPTDINLILRSANIKAVFCYPNTHVEAIKLPSTSPANAAFSIDRLIDIWSFEINKILSVKNG